MTQSINIINQSKICGLYAWWYMPLVLGPREADGETYLEFMILRP